MELYNVNFSYIDGETLEERYVSVPEQGGGKLIPEGLGAAGQVYTVSAGKNGMQAAVFKLETQMTQGSGKFSCLGIGSDRECKESANTGFNYLKAHSKEISTSISTVAKDYIVNYADLQGVGMTSNLALPTLIALCSIALERPIQTSLVVLDDISITGSLIKAENLVSALQACKDAGAKRIMLPSISMAEYASVPSDLIAAFQIIPYTSATEAVFRALGAE